MIPCSWRLAPLLLLLAPLLAPSPSLALLELRPRLPLSDFREGVVGEGDWKPGGGDREAGATATGGEGVVTAELSCTL